MEFISGSSILSICTISNVLLLKWRPSQYNIIVGKKLSLTVVFTSLLWNLYEKLSFNPYFQNTIQDSNGREGTTFYSALPIPPAFVCLLCELILGFCYSDLTWEAGGSRWITLALQVNRLTKSASHLKTLWRNYQFSIYIFKGASWYPPSWPLPNPAITHRDNQACVAAQAFIATLLFDPSMSALPIIVKQNSPSVSSSFR